MKKIQITIGTLLFLQSRDACPIEQDQWQNISSFVQVPRFSPTENTAFLQCNVTNTRRDLNRHPLEMENVGTG